MKWFLLFLVLTLLLNLHFSIETNKFTIHVKENKNVWQKAVLTECKPGFGCRIGNFDPSYGMR